MDSDAIILTILGGFGTSLKFWPAWAPEATWGPHQGGYQDQIPHLVGGPQ